MWESSHFYIVFRGVILTQIIIFDYLSCCVRKFLYICAMQQQYFIMLIEQTTTYSYKLKYLDNPTFDKVRDFAKKFIDDLPKELVDGLYEEI